MFKESCPGSSEIRQPYPEEITCRTCGMTLEIWSDETDTTCPHCGNTADRFIGPTCIDWCPHARECIGAEKYDRLMKRNKAG